jgi:hypothetical protein
MRYQEFLENKIIRHKPSGFAVDELNPMLFDWQQVLVRWALYKGKAALFEDCGLGKTPQQLEWAYHVTRETGLPVLILAPLAVSNQTRREGEKFGIDVNVCRTHDDVKNCINITNYEKLQHFHPEDFAGVVLDESSIIKNYSGKIRNQIIDTFMRTPYKLCATATPSPNDFTELGNTSEFLSVMTRAEMLAMYFINDTGDTGTWRLKGHVKDNLFWQWLASWSVMLRFPSNIGFDDNGFALPPLEIHEHIIPYKGESSSLFVEPASTLSERRDARKESLPERVARAASLVNESTEQWLVWCNMNDESAALSASVKDSVEIKGADSSERKERAMLDFQAGNIKCLVSKPSICGFGMNFQGCSNMAFVGLSDSFEQYYQAVRRCWRFGQKNTVHAHVITGEREGAVVANIKRKEADMEAMFNGMIGHMAGIVKQELTYSSRTFTDYQPVNKMALPGFLEVC